ncbi:MAG: hypothetical protein AAGU27_16535 [Dehalobacterium sp.]
MEETLSKILAELQSLNSRNSGVEEGQKLLNSRISSVEEGQRLLNSRISGIEEGQRLGFEGVNKKLDAISVQVAHNTEQEIRLNDVISKVAEHDTDIKLMKKFFINQ